MGIKFRVVQLPAIAVKRNKAAIAQSICTIADLINNRRSLARKAVGFAKLYRALRIGITTEHSHAIFTQQFHFRASHRFAGGGRHDKHLLATVAVMLNQQA